MKRNVTVLIRLMAGIILLAAQCAAAEDTVDHFFLPETPPSIERQKRPPLDRPNIKKQNFVTDPDLATPPVLLDSRFPSFGEERFPVSLGISHGSFSTIAGRFAFASPRGWDVAYEGRNSGGEFSNMYRERNILTCRAAQLLAPDLRAGGDASVEQKTFWQQHHSLYRLNAALAWYARTNVNVKVEAAAAQSGYKGGRANDSLDAAVSSFWQADERQQVIVSLSRQHDSAFTEAKNFSSASLVYLVSLGRGMAAGGGGRFENGTFFAQGEYRWHFLPRTGMTVTYRPGFDRPDWERLYDGERYVQTPPSLRSAEKTFHLKETLYHYWDDESYAELECGQESVRDYVYWSAVPGSAFIAPANLFPVFLSSVKLKMRRRFERMTPFLEASYTVHPGIPLVPDAAFSCGIDYQASSWTFSPGYEYVAARRILSDRPDTIAAYGRLSLTVTRRIAPGITCFVSGDNLLGETIEYQPGFLVRSGTFAGGVAVEFF